MKPLRFAAVQALMEEPADVRQRIGGHLRALADEIGDLDPATRAGLVDAASIIERGYREVYGFCCMGCT